MSGSEASLNRRRAFKLDFRDIYVGWASLVLISPGARHITSCSYTTDVLGQIVSAALLLKQGANAAYVVIEQEPGQIRCRLDWCVEIKFHENGRSMSRPRIRLRVWFFADPWDDSDDADGELLLEHEVPESQLFEAVIKLIERVIRRYGLEGYRELWLEHPIPTAAYTELLRVCRAGEDPRYL